MIITYETFFWCTIQQEIRKFRNQLLFIHFVIKIASVPSVNADGYLENVISDL